MLLSIRWDEALLILLNYLNDYPVTITCFLILLIITFGIAIDYIITPKEIANIFPIPGELPFIGHLHLILENPALIYLTWSKLYNQSIFQIRIGNKRVVVVNSFDDVVGLWVNHSCQNNSRPLSYTFHDLVSAIQGFTIGSTPASLTFQKKKKTISQYLNKRQIELKLDTINRQINIMIGELWKRDIEFEDINLLPYFQKFVLQTAIYIGYGIELDFYKEHSQFCQEIIDIENKIIRLRSPISNLQDSIPLLRIMPRWFNNSEIARMCGERRNSYMNKLYQQLQQGLAEDLPQYKNSILGDLITKTTNTQNNNDDSSDTNCTSHNNCLNEQEIQSICLTLISAGLDNTPLSLNYLFGILSHPKIGEHLQNRAIQDILENSGGNIVLAWEKVLLLQGLMTTNQQNPMNCQYIEALVLETLRHFTVLPLSLPRLTTKAIRYKDFVIPKETHLFMNAYSANHDCQIFVNPYKFDPDRWLDPVSNSIKSQFLNFIINNNSKSSSGHGHQFKSLHSHQHFAFGAGSRMCSGYNLVIKQMYVMIIKMLLIFEIHSPTNIKKLMELNPFKNNLNPKGTSFEPKTNHINLKFRKLPNYKSLHELVLHQS